ncbi:hypothetical protein PTKIN_Ptkin06aG0020700 [Pterospermum kingtungense]
MDHFTTERKRLEYTRVCIETDMKKEIISGSDWLAIQNNKIVMSSFTGNKEMTTKDKGKSVMPCDSPNVRREMVKKQSPKKSVKLCSQDNKGSENRQQREALKKFTKLMNTIKPKSNSNKGGAKGGSKGGIKPANGDPLTEINVIIVYVANDGINRRRLWLHLFELHFVIDCKDWLMAGDYNVLPNPEDCFKFSDDTLVNADTKEFKECKEKLGFFITLTMALLLLRPIGKS